MTLIAKIGRELDKAWRKLRAPRGLRELPPDFPLDFSKFTKQLWRQVSPNTMTSKERVLALENAVRHVHAHGIEGDIVECGVAWGGSVMAFALTLIELGESGRTIWLYDTFAGMPEPSEEDIGRHGEVALRAYHKKRKDGISTWINAPIEQVKKNVFSSGYPEHRFRFVEGRVEETLIEQKPETIAILRLDTDWHQSTKAELEHLYPRLARGGIIILDDYYRWDGHRKAADQYFADHDLRIFWARIDDHAVIGVKE